MENVEETDNITKNIVQEIIRECTTKNVEIDENFCAYYVKLLTLDPIWQISPEKKLNRENIQRLVTFIIEKLENVQCPSLITMKIQHYFLSSVTSRTSMIESQRQLLTESLEPLLTDILNFTHDELNKTSEHRLYRRIVLYITLLSGLGNPKRTTVIKEATFALRSVLDETDLPEFIELKDEEKQVELEQFKDLVTGIRLFNRDCGRPAAEIEDLPKILAQALGATQIELQNELLRVMERVNLTTSAIENVYSLKKYCKSISPHGTSSIPTLYCYTMALTLPEDITMEFLQYTLDMLILSRQHEVYVRKLLSDVREIEENAKKLFNSLQEVFSKLHTVVKYKVAIPTNVVYPLFMELSQIWKQIQEQAIVLSLYNQIYQKLHKMVKAEVIDEEQIKIMIGSGQILTDAMRLEKTMGFKISQQNNDCEVLDPLRIKDFDKIPLQFLGFCAWSLVETEGGLIPGNPNMGICKWKEKYYVFSSVEAAIAFGLDPESFVLQALEIARNKSELINLLQLHDQVCSVREVGVLYEKPAEVVMTSSAGIQTDLHPVPRNIDPKYVWNIWDYYRKAIKLANIAKCQTNSSQTNKSHYRYPVFVQTTEPRDKICQTKKDNYVNVATPSNFIFGLRGRVDDKQHIIDLTRPVDENWFHECATAMDNPPSFNMKFKKCQKHTVNKSMSEPKRKDSVPVQTACKPCKLLQDEPSLDEKTSDELTGSVQLIDLIKVDKCECRPRNSNKK